MTSRSTLTVILFDWHANKRSQAADDTLFGPLAPYFEFDTHSVDWFEKLDPGMTYLTGTPAVFFYTPPPFDVLRSHPKQVSWIPMWDSVRHYAPDFWPGVPHNIRIVAFADAVARQTRAVGLNTLRLQYFSDPDTLPPADWSRERVAFYWNRTGLVSPGFLRRWCAALRIDRLLFKPELDPFINPNIYFTLPERLGNTRVEVIPHTERREDFFRLTEPANIVLAPRTSEGIGLTFIEALARGCAVFGFNAATMNEYIQHGQTGYLFSMTTPLIERAISRVRNGLTRRGIRVGRHLPHTYFLNENQPWEEIAKLDLETLGRQAREAHTAGYAAWRRSLPAYAAFLAGE